MNHSSVLKECNALWSEVRDCACENDEQKLSEFIETQRGSGLRAEGGAN